ncbi:spore coat protein, partial [Bacillus wiedmannii]
MKGGELMDKACHTDENKKWSALD